MSSLFSCSKDGASGQLPPFGGGELEAFIKKGLKKRKFSINFLLTLACSCTLGCDTRRNLSCEKLVAVLCLHQYIPFRRLVNQFQIQLSMYMHISC